MEFIKHKLPPNPMAKANIFSRTLFLWIMPLFWKGYRKELELEDLYDILKEDRAEHLGNKLERVWTEELQKAKLQEKKPSLFKSLVKLFWKRALFIAIVYAFNQCVIIMSQPVFLRLLIVTFDEKEPEVWKGYTYAGALSLAVFLNTIVIHPMIFQIMQIGMRIRVALTILIYRKTLKLSKSAQQKTNAGHIVNLISNDCTRFDNNMIFFPLFVNAPILTVTSMYLLYDEIGISFVAGVAFILCLLPLQYYFGKYSAIFRLKIANCTDERGRMMNEVIGGMRVIKQYAWEKPFSILIDKLRKLEIVEIKKRGVIHGLHNALMTFAPKLVQYLTFLAFVLLGDEPMTSDKVFFALATLHIVIQITISFLPIAVAGAGEIIVSIQRIQQFLLLDEKPDTFSSLITSTEKHHGKDLSEKEDKRKIVMQNVSASWVEGDRKTLENVTLSVDDDKLLMVVGSVGSSKSSLLQTIIRELPISSGNLCVNGSYSYASQEPWIFAGNLRQNILFGLEYDETRYLETITACALKADLRQLPYGDMTVVGERGVALSGGQRARVNLARAVYREADIYIFDDPLSAVDTEVSRHLFERCIQKHLGGKTRILVTHQLQYMQHADHIVVLGDGKVIAQGSFEELVQSGVDFVGLLNAGEAETKEGPQKRLSSVSQQTVECEDNFTEIEKPEENIEKKMGGSVTAKTYWDYFMSGHTVLGFASLTFLIILCQVLTSGNDWWLSYWTNAEAKRMELERNNFTVCGDDDACKSNYLGENVYLYAYTGFVVSVIVTSLIRAVWFFMYCAGCSVNIHNRMFSSMARTAIRFFDDNPSGRIMNRFTRDIGIIDELLPLAFHDTIVICLQCLGVFVLVIVSNYYMSIPTVILFFILIYIRKVFLETARDVKRIESITRSPIFTHVTATLQGLTTIRSCQTERVLIRQFEGHQDTHSSAWFLFLGTNRCFGIWLELFSDAFLFVVAFSFLLISTSNEGGNVGLAISSILSLMGEFQWGMRQSAETENYMTSVERALEYSKLEPEAELNSKPDSAPSSKWPVLGQIEFENMSLYYTDDKPVLKVLNFKILPSEKIGIVGRTGAGKSSIIAALFRMAEPEGNIIIDNVKIKEIGLHDLRKKISIIPQDPVLFSGSVRYNLDPFDQFDDKCLWEVIQEVELSEAVISLDQKVADGGSNFSVGQRQLFCLARAILKRNKILVLDEATANVDYRTDNLIQQTIREKFADCTIITIAHRLHSVIDCDRILVLDHGNLMEYDHPHSLLQDENSIFTGMVKQTGQSATAMLRKLAQEASLRKRNAPNTDS